jgi:hypothetical protein
MEFTTLRTLTTDLLNIIRASNISASETISKRQIEDWIHQYRALLIKQDLDKGKIPNPDYIQEIGNIKLEKVDIAGDDITSLGIESGINIYRTALEIPNTIDLNFKSGFTYIGTPMGDELQLIPETRSKWQQYKKYTSKDKLVYLRNKRLYVPNHESLGFLTTRGIHENPAEVGRFVNPITNQPYFDLDSKYPIPVNMIPILKEMILTKELKIESAALTDNTNNYSHNLEQPISK